jgi:hypothetical protein
VVEAQEIEPRAVFLQVDDGRLGLLRLQAELGQQRPQPRERGFGLLPGLAQHQQVVGEPDDHTVPRRRRSTSATSAESRSSTQSMIK